LPVDFLVTQPIRGLHERRALTQLCQRKARAVVCFAEVRAWELTRRRRRRWLQDTNLCDDTVTLAENGLNLDDRGVA
jgi:hypothetical protein